MDERSNSVAASPGIRGADIIDALLGVDTRTRRTGWTRLFVVYMAAPLQNAVAEEGSAARNESSITVYGGDRFGGSVTDSTTDSTLNLDNGSSFGVALDIGLEQNTQLELFYSQQKTTITSGALSSPVNSAGFTLHNYHVGGTNFIDQPGRGLYVMGGLGGTTLIPDQRGLNSQTFFSGNLGVGWMVPLGATSDCDSKHAVTVSCSLATSPFSAVAP